MKRPMLSPTRLCVVGALAFLAWSGCDALVGGECLPGFVPREGACLPPSTTSASGGSTASSSDGGAGAAAGGATAAGGMSSTSGGGNGGRSNSGGSSSNGGPSGTGGSGCTPPLTPCPDGCVDLQTDPNNCGSCGNECLTEICIDGVCTGNPIGHLLVIGMSYAEFNAPTRQALGNSVFLPSNDPVRILDYRKHSHAANAQVVDDLIAAEAVKRSRSYGVTNVSLAAAVAPALDTGIYDIFLMHDQPNAPVGQLGAFGTIVASSIASFAKKGGTIIVLASHDGINEMDEFLTNSGILATQALNDVTGAAIVNQAPTDVMGIGVQSPFLAKSLSSHIVTTEPPNAFLTFVFTDSAMPPNPVGIHKTLAGK